MLRVLPALILVLSMTVSSRAAAIPGEIILASTTDAGVKGTAGPFADSHLASLSSDGNKVAFYSWTHLEPADADLFSDVYVKDLASGDTTLAATSDNGAKGNHHSRDPALSSDGSKVAFVTTANNLDPADTDNNADVYVKDLITGDITLASTSDTGIKGPGAGGLPPALSSDGTKVAFLSLRLEPGDNDFFTDVYVKDLITGEVTQASTSDAGVQQNGHSADRLALSSDGTKVAFQTRATNLDPADTEAGYDIYVKDLTTGDITLASSSDNGLKGNGESEDPVLTSDGSRVAFSSLANNLDPADTDTIPDVYVKDLITGAITLVSTSDADIKGDGGSGWAAFSSDGTKLAFGSGATNLDPADTDDPADVYVKDLITGDITLASTSDNAVKGNGFSGFPSLSSDGTTVAFESTANNLDPADTDPDEDIYVKQLGGVMNQPPVAVDDFAQTRPSVNVTINVLANDSDPESDPLSVTGVSDPPNGTATVNPDRTVTYDPDGCFIGTDIFTYTIADGRGGTSEAAVMVRVRRTSRSFC